MATGRTRSEPPLIVIVGPTASGKTALAIEIAKRYNGEVVSADSRTVYRVLSVGTAKPSTREQQAIPHWGIDIANPNERYTAADFQRYAQRAIHDIRHRGKLPILVGGTGLYIDSVIYEYQFPGVYDTSLQKELQFLSVEELQERCKENNIRLPQNHKNKLHLVSALLRGNQQLVKRAEPIANCVVVGIATDRQELHDRIAARADQLFTKATIDEAITTANNYGWDIPAMSGNIYPIIHRYINGELTLDDAKQKFIISDRQLAKRQMTWFRRSKAIKWLDRDNAYTYIARLLDRLNNS